MRYRIVEAIVVNIALFLFYGREYTVLFLKRNKNLLKCSELL